MKNRTTFFSICIAMLFMLLQVSIKAQFINWQWAKNDGGTGALDQASTVAVDTKGNVLVTGYFNGTSIIFGSTTLNNASAGTYDMYIVKYNASGTVLWAKSAGGANSDYGISVSTDALDNVYVSGYFKSSTIVFGSTTLTNGNPPFGDSFLAKYDANGNVISAINDIGSTSSNSIGSLSIFPNAVYAGGTVQSSSLTFGSKTVNNANAPNQNPFIVKFNASGTALWITSPTGNTANNALYSISADAKGNVFATGIFASSSITFGSTTLTNASAGTNDIFVVKYDSNGNVMWAKGAGGAANDYASCASADGLGNVYICGSFKSATITFGSYTLTNNGFSSSYSTSYIAKYDVNGNVSWAVTTGGSAVSNGTSSVWANSKGVYAAGEFQGTTIQFGAITLNNINSPNEEPFLTRYDALGNAVWATNPIGNTSTINLVSSVTSDNSGGVSVAGYFASSSLTFGSTPSIVNASAGTNDMFVAHLYDSSVTVGITPVTYRSTISIYPNPFSSSSILEIQNGQFQTSKTECTLYDVLGREVFNIEIHSARTVIERGSLPAGMYFYQVKNQSEILSTGKLIIQ